MQQFKASTQYGDLKGDVVVDGYQGPFINELAEQVGIPENYFAIGLLIDAGEPGRSDGQKEPYWSIHIAASDKNHYGDSIDDIHKKAIAEGQLVVKLFDANIKPEKLLPYIKRLSIAIVNRNLVDVTVMSEDAL